MGCSQAGGAPHDAVNGRMSHRLINVWVVGYFIGWYAVFFNKNATIVTLTPAPPTPAVFGQPKDGQTAGYCCDKLTGKERE